MWAIIRVSYRILLYCLVVSLARVLRLIRFVFCFLLLRRPGPLLYYKICQSYHSSSQYSYDIIAVFIKCVNYQLIRLKGSYHMPACWVRLYLYPFTGSPTTTTVVIQKQSITEYRIIVRVLVRFYYLFLLVLRERGKSNTKYVTTR